MPSTLINQCLTSMKEGWELHAAQCQIVVVATPHHTNVIMIYSNYIYGLTIISMNSVTLQ